MRLLELNQEVFHESKYKYLYHLTNAHGFSFNIDNNALRPLRQSDVSTTTNPDINWIQGRDHLAYKFVLKAPELLATYGGYKYVDHYYEIGGGSRKKVNMKEDEIRIHTNSIEPLIDYLVGVVIVFPMFSQKAVQDLLYDRRGSKGFMDAETSDATRSVEAIWKVMFEWKKPVWILDDGKPRNLTTQELEFIRDAHKISKRTKKSTKGSPFGGAAFGKGLATLSDKYPVKDHWGKDLDSTMVRRRNMGDAIAKILNSYYANRKVQSVNVNKVREIWQKIFDKLNVNSNMRAVVMGAIEDSGLLHPITAAVDWTGIVRDLMDGDVDAALEHIKFIAKRNEYSRKEWDTDPKNPYRKYRIHYGTSM